MRITFMEEESLLTLKSNLENIYHRFALPTAEWVCKYFGRSPFLETRYKVEKFDLDMSQEKPYLTEFENVRRVYNRLGFLSPSQASDERLWSALCINHFWKYTQYRWNIVSRCTAKNVKDHFFFGFSPRRSLTRNAISRLWWIGHLTYDEQRSDPWELTQFVCENADYVLHILERNTSNNHMIVRAFITALIEARNDGYRIDTNVVGELSKYLNLLGGTYILDCLPEDVLRVKILKQAKRISS